MNHFIILLFYILFIILLNYSFKITQKYPNLYNQNIKNDNFYDILPSINTSTKINNITLIYEIFKSKQLFINDNNLTKQYIHFIRSIKDKKSFFIDKEFNKKNFQNNITFNINDFENNEEQISYKVYGKICVEEKLINSNNIKDSNPIISIIVPSFNKYDVILKSIRSIQNQSFKNIEIIIVDDFSTDNSSSIFKYLLKSDPRVRIFTHLKNMGVWRTRLDGFLYSRGKYIIHFDAGDLYSDPFVLEDAYNIIEKYKLDSVKMMFRLIYNYSNFEQSTIPFEINSDKMKIVYEPHNIKKYNDEIFSTWGNIWSRLTRANIVSKGLYLLDSKILNIYKNLWEDCWWNRIIDEASNNFLIINRISYLYYKDGNGEGDIKTDNNIQKNKIIIEFLNFLYFDLNLLPKNDNKNTIIKKLHQYTKCKKINLNFLISNFDILNHILVLLINDPFVSNIKKVFLKRLIKESKIKEKKLKNIKIHFF